MEEGKINESERAQTRKKEVCVYMEREGARDRGVETIRRDKQSSRWMGTPPRSVSSLSAQSRDNLLRRKSSIIPVRGMMIVSVCRDGI